MSKVEKQSVSGQFLDMEGQPETEDLLISINLPADLYKAQSQIVCSQKAVEMDASGKWETELADTDNMLAGAYYIFEINGRTYEKYVPVAIACHNFNDLPDVIF